MMKVRLSASRQPYMRAGIAIGARGVFTILERDDITAEQWLALLSDPVVQIALSDDEGQTWVSPSDEQRSDVTASVKRAVKPVSSQGVTLDFSATEAVFVKAGVSTIAELTDRVDQLLHTEAAYSAGQRMVLDQGFHSIADLVVSFQRGQEELAALKEAAEQNSTADRQGGAPAEVVPPPAGDGEGQGAAEGDKTAAPAEQVEKPVSAGKAKPARKTHTKPAGE